MTQRPTSPITPYSFVQPPAQYDAGEESKHRLRIKQGSRPIGVRFTLVDGDITAADDTVIANTSGGPISLTLPRADGSRNLQLNVLNIGADTLTIVGTVNGVVNPTFAQYDGATIVCDGVDYWKIGST